MVHSDSCYIFTSTAMRWDVASTHCSSFGFHLAQITNSAENDAMVHLYHDSLATPTECKLQRFIQETITK